VFESAGIALSDEISVRQEAQAMEMAIAITTHMILD